MRFEVGACVAARDDGSVFEVLEVDVGVAPERGLIQSVDDTPGT
ncbi:hypothetical protein ACWF82_34090 [Nocardia sp. NPDC055053]